MFISPAWAWNSVPGTGGSGGAHALTIILTVGVTVLLLYVAQKRWRRWRASRRGDSE
jgi:hypothetical protein